MRSSFKQIKNQGIKTPSNDKSSQNQVADKAEIDQALIEAKFSLDDCVASLKTAKAALIKKSSSDEDIIYI